jgi:hypothetical protein
VDIKLENKIEWIKPKLEFLGKVLSISKGEAVINCEPICSVGDHASSNCYKGNHVGK